MCAGELFVAESAHDSSRRANDQRTRRNFLAFGDQAVRTNDAILTDDCIVEHDRVHTNQRSIFNCAAVQHHLMGDADAIADAQWHARVDVQDAHVLNVRAFADGDDIIVSAHHTLEPDTGVRFHDH